VVCWYVGMYIDDMAVVTQLVTLSLALLHSKISFVESRM
jgi:hypothetical protein